MFAVVFCFRLGVAVAEVVFVLAVCAREAECVCVFWGVVRKGGGSFRFGNGRGEKGLGPSVGGARGRSGGCGCGYLFDLLGDGGARWGGVGAGARDVRPATRIADGKACDHDCGCSKR